MRPTALGSVVMTFRQEPLVRMYDRKSVVVLATPGYDITTDHHLFDTLSSLNLTEKAIVEDALSTLGFDFGVLIISEEQVFLGCGPRSFIKLFFQVTDSSLLVRDHLPQGLDPPKRADTLNTEAIISFFGSSMAVGAFEIRRTTACIDRHWRCVPNSQAVIVDAKNRTFSGYPFDNIWNLFHNDDIGARDAIERARSKLEGFITRSSRLGGVCVEASGGIDSGIVMATAKNNPNSSFRCGISCEYPFFEFAREIRFRRDLYESPQCKSTL